MSSECRKLQSHRRAEGAGIAIIVATAFVAACGPSAHGPPSANRASFRGQVNLACTRYSRATAAAEGRLEARAKAARSQEELLKAYALGLPALAVDLETLTDSITKALTLEKIRGHEWEPLINSLRSSARVLSDAAAAARVGDLRRFHLLLRQPVHFSARAFFVSHGFLKCGLAGVPK
jgi:hypothetical protein